jgi:hypothetical protein
MTRIGHGGDGSGSRFLDLAPAAREVRVTIGQAPQTMQMIGQHHDRLDGKGLVPVNPNESLAQGRDVSYLGEPWLSFMGDNGEKISATRHEDTAVLAHGKQAQVP